MPVASYSIFTYSQSHPPYVEISLDKVLLVASNMILTFAERKLLLWLKYTWNSLALAQQRVSEATWQRLGGGGRASAKAQTAQDTALAEPNKDFGI